VTCLKLDQDRVASRVASDETHGWQVQSPSRHVPWGPHQKSYPNPAFPRRRDPECDGRRAGTKSAQVSSNQTTASWFWRN